MATINERVLDAAVRRQLRLLRFTNGEVRQVLAALYQMQRDVSDLLAARLLAIEARGRDLGPVSTRRLAALLEDINSVNLAFFAGFEQQMRTGMADLAENEARFQQRLLQDAFASAQVAILPDLRTVRAIVNTTAIRGMSFPNWMTTARTNAYRRIENQVRLGMIEGATLPQIVRSARQVTARATRNGLIATVRTIVNHTAAQTREKVYEANEQFLKGVQWVSTLDTRTSDICIQRDGKVYPVGEGPRPPAHFACRSATVPVINGSPQFGERASMFGPVPERTTYSQWLARQSAAVQDEALGPTRGLMFRRGELDLSRLADPVSGRSLSLGEL